MIRSLFALLLLVAWKISGGPIPAAVVHEDEFVIDPECGEALREPRVQ